MEGAQLPRADFSGINLLGVNLARADLIEAVFAGIAMTGANLADACITGVMWSMATVWPAGYGEQVMARSEEIGNGVFRVSGGDEQVPRGVALAT
jgi:hypothetical protein